MLTGGTDTYTGLAFQGVLSSAGRSPAISPLTTLVEAVAVARGDTTMAGIGAADALVVGAFKLPAGIDLSSYVPGAVLSDSTASTADVTTAQAVYRAGASLLEAQTLTDAAGGSGWTALEETARSLADGSLTDLTDLTAVIDRGGLTLDADAAARIIDAATAADLDFQLDESTAPDENLASISGASIALQGDASAALRAASDGGFGKVATDYVTALAATLKVDYFHIELDTHSVILAERAPSETFVDDGSRLMFHNAAEYRALYPDEPGGPVRFCAPRIKDGTELELIRSWLERRASRSAAGATAAGPRRLRGCVDVVDRDRVQGWAWDEAAPNESVVLRVLDNGVVIARVVAGSYRADLRTAGIGDGRHAFDVALPGGLSPLVAHAIRVESEADGASLENGGGTMEADAHAEPTATCAPPLPAGPRTSSAEDRRKGYVDIVNRRRVAGWAWDAVRPDRPLTLQIFDNGVLVAQVVANRHRPDLHQAGIGYGRYGFDYDIPGGLSALSAHMVHVRYAEDGLDLAHSPAFVAIPKELDDALERDIANALGGACQHGDPERILSFLAAQAERVLQGRADAQSGRDLRQRHRRLLRRHEAPGAAIARGLGPLPWSSTTTCRGAAATNACWPAATCHQS